MTGPDVKTPTHVFYFEVLLYLSLMIDTLSLAFFDRTPDDLGAQSPVINLISALLILATFYLIWLAAHRRKRWARTVLMAFLMLSTASLVAATGETGIQFTTLLDVISTVLTAFGLYFSFTGDARDWFQ